MPENGLQEDFVHFLQIQKITCVCVKREENVEVGHYQAHVLQPTREKSRIPPPPSLFWTREVASLAFTGSAEFSLTTACQCLSVSGVAGFFFFSGSFWLECLPTLTPIPISPCWAPSMRAVLGTLPALWQMWSGPSRGFPLVDATVPYIKRLFTTSWKIQKILYKSCDQEWSIFSCHDIITTLRWDIVHLVCFSPPQYLTILGAH